MGGPCLSNTPLRLARPIVVVVIRMSVHCCISYDIDGPCSVFTGLLGRHFYLASAFSVFRFFGLCISLLF